MPESFLVKDILTDFKETAEWFKTLNKGSIDNTRIPDIIKYLEYFVDGYDRYKRGEYEDFLKNVDSSGTALNEATALNLIRKELSKLNSSRLPKKELQKCILGSFHSTEEKALDGSNNARNALFELETAAYLISCGFDITEEFEDVNYNIYNYKISIQCKRLLKLGNLEDHFSKAVTQLIEKNKVIDDVNSFGLIAFSLEKLYGLDNGIVQVQDKKEIQHIMDKTVKEFNEKIVPLWNATIKRYEKIKLIGMMYFYKRPVIYINNNRFSFLRRFIYHIPVFPEGSIFNDIAKYINDPSS